MPKVILRKARKDFPDQGIAKGDMYYYVSVMTGPRSSRVIRSLTPPRRSQLTSSEFNSKLYEIEDALAAIPSDDGLADALRQVASDLTDLGSEEAAKFENMPENLQAGHTQMEERAENCDTWAEAITSACDDLDTELGEIEDKTPDELELCVGATEEEIEAAKDKARADAYQVALDAIDGSKPF